MVIYLDNSSTSHPKPDVVYTALDEAQRQYVNASRGFYPLSMASQEALFDARENIASYFHIADSSRLIFTYNCTYGLNILLNSINIKEPFKIAICPMSHNAVYRPASFHAQNNGYDLPILKYHQETTIDYPALENLLKEDKDIKVVIITHASNVSGELIALDVVASLVHQYDAYVIVDGAQSVGHIDVDVEALGLDGFVFSGHKALYGPQGIGCAYISPNLPTKQVFSGGTGSYSEWDRMPPELPEKFEPGTVNLPGAMALSTAINYLRGVDRSLEQVLLHHVIDEVSRMKGATVLSQKRQRVPVISFIHEHKTPDDIAQKLADDYAIATRFGIHCAPVAHKSLGTFPDGTVRVSLGLFNTEDHVQSFLKGLYNILKSS